MNARETACVEQAKAAALEVLLHNRRGPYRGLPRTAGWGYPEPYTRDLMIAAFGVLTTDNEKLVHSLKRVLENVASNQNPLGHIPSLIHDPKDRGASDCTPLFLVAVALYRIAAGRADFLESAVEKAMRWMEYRSPYCGALVGQLPTSDWRDEQWVLGYGLYVNALVHTYLKLYGQDERAEQLRQEMHQFVIEDRAPKRHIREGLVLRHRPYYAMWAYKIYSSERFDLLGNSLAVLSGIASATRARQLVSWIETECSGMRIKGDLSVNLPPNFFPFIRPLDPDWMPRYEQHNMPGEYHNGGIWPFVCGFHIAAVVAVGRVALAERKLLALTELVRGARDHDVAFGFNEWYRPADGRPGGQDWQTWSAAMYLYAAECVQSGQTPYFDKMRTT
ncbi:MAG: amylo-alpha-1,6-glucosidase [Phycisphaerae bacterium]|nr:amylo-alpha-1,6-glucosidase [Phycisphaerae bacterium]